MVGVARLTTPQATLHPFPLLLSELHNFLRALLGPTRHTKGRPTMSPDGNTKSPGPGLELLTAGQEQMYPPLKRLAHFMY